MKGPKFHFMLIWLSLLLYLPLQGQEIALQLYSLRDQMKSDVEGTHLLPSKWGIKYLEGGSTYGFSLDEYQELLASHDLSIISVGADFQQLKDNPQEIIESAHAYGAKYATCFWIPHPSKNFSMKEAKEAVEVFNKAGKIFKDNGITLTYHPHGYEFKSYNNGVLFDYMIENAQHYEFNMDVFWVKMGGGDPLQLMKKYPDKFPLLHLKDRKKGTLGNPFGTGDVESNVVLGTGDIDIKGIILEAKKIGTKYLIIEDESSRSVAQIPLSINYIKQVLNEN